MKLNKPSGFVSMFKESALIAKSWNKKSGEPVVDKLRGRENSRVLLLAPPLDPSEYEAGIPFCGEAAKQFHMLLEDHRMNTEKDFLVVPCSLYGAKPSKHSTELIKELLEKSFKRDMFDYCICVGADAFKYVLGGGKKPSSAALYGSTIFTPTLAYKPLFTFPCPSMLVPLPGKSEWEIRKAENIAASNKNKFHALVLKLKKSLQHYKVEL